MTLLQVRSGHRVIGRCDEKCYLAGQERCRCVCGGKNHGVGLKRALEITLKEAGDDQKVIFKQMDLI